MGNEFQINSLRNTCHYSRILFIYLFFAGQGEKYDDFQLFNNLSSSPQLNGISQMQSSGKQEHVCNSEECLLMSLMKFDEESTMEENDSESGNGMSQHIVDGSVSNDSEQLFEESLTELNSVHDSSDVFGCFLESKDTTLDGDYTVETEMKNGNLYMALKGNTTEEEKSQTESTDSCEITDNNQISLSQCAPEQHEKETLMEQDKEVIEHKTMTSEERSGPEKKHVEIYCKECEHLFKYKESYDKHLKEDRCRHVCDICGKIFLYAKTKDYKIHVKYHTQQRDHECEICGKRFIERGTMLRHLRLHTIESPKKDKEMMKKEKSAKRKQRKAKDRILKQSNYHCNDCEHTFKRKASYEKHLREDRCKHVCDICGKVFLYLRTKDYIIHMKYHTKQKDHECFQCGKRFVEKGKLLKHIRRHKT